MSILSIDPGENVGFATFNEEGRSLNINEAKSDDFIGLLADLSPLGLSAVVVEDYRLQQGKQKSQTGSKFETVQVIGAARLYARLHTLPFITQSPQILRVTGMHMHMNLPVGHIPDRTSALLHGFRYFIEVRGIETSVLRERNALG